MSNKEVVRGSVEFCIVCFGDIQYIKMGEDGHVHPDVMNKGNSFDIVGGYGSCHDSSLFEAFICDECLSKAIAEGKVRILNEE